jgi:nitrite reductase/ring-hydroxylating ferredoxin subunit
MQEKEKPMEGEWVRVASADEIPDGEMIGVKVGEHEIALFRLADTFYATDNICSHEFAYLTEGFFETDDFVVECPLHAGQFDIRTGKGICSPVDDQVIRTFPTRKEGNDVLLRID